MKFFDLLKTISKAKIKYLVVGGIAVNLHGIIRATKDIDFVVYLEEANVRKFCKLMTRLGYLPKVPVKAEDFADQKKRNDWIKNKNMIVFCFYHKNDLMNVIDVFVKHPLPFEGMYKRRTVIKIDEVSVSVIGIKDLIKLKEKANRLQDQSDILLLRKVLKVQKGLKNEKKK